MKGADIDVARAPAALQIVRDFANRVANEDGVGVLSVEEFVEFRAAGHLHYALDVRLPHEYREGHIPGSVSLPGGQVALAADEVVAVNQAPIVLVSEYRYPREDYRLVRPSDRLSECLGARRRNRSLDEFRR